jgi:hypothetical protein
MITPIPSALFNLEDLIDLSDQILDAIRNEVEDQTIYYRFKSQVSQARKLMVSEQWGIDKENEHLRDADENRDNAFLSFRDGLRALTLRLNEEVKNTAKSSYKHVLEAGYSLHNYSDRDQSFAMKKLFDAFASEEERSRLKELHQLDAFVEMKEAQEHFEELMAELDAENSVDDLDEYRRTKREIRKELKAFLSDIKGLLSDSTMELVNQTIKISVAKKR